MSAQECPTCGAPPGIKCRNPGRAFPLDQPHASRLTLEYGAWCEIYDHKWRDRTLKFQCRPKGVTYSRVEGKWKAWLFGPKKIWLGRFDTMDEAIRAVRRAQAA